MILPEKIEKSKFIFYEFNKLKENSTVWFTDFLGLYFFIF